MGRTRQLTPRHARKKTHKMAYNPQITYSIVFLDEDTFQLKHKGQLVTTFKRQ